MSYKLRSPREMIEGLRAQGFAIGPEGESVTVTPELRAKIAAEAAKHAHQPPNKKYKAYEDKILSGNNPQLKVSSEDITEDTSTNDITQKSIDLDEVKKQFKFLADAISSDPYQAEFKEGALANFNKAQESRDMADNMSTIGSKLPLQAMFAMHNSLNPKKQLKGFDLSSPEDYVKERLARDEKLAKEMGDLSKYNLYERLGLAALAGGGQIQKQGTGSKQTEKVAAVAATPAPVKNGTYEKEFNKALEKFGKDTAGIAAVNATYDLLNKAVEKHSGVSIDNVTQNDKLKDIPGIGGINNFFNMAFSDKGADVKSLFKRLQDDLLRAKSGASINEQEYQRLSTTLGGNKFARDKDAIISLKNFKKELIAVLKEKEAPYVTRPRVLEEYGKKGLTSAKLKDPIDWFTSKEASSPDGMKRSSKSIIQKDPVTGKEHTYILNEKTGEYE